MFDFKMSGLFNKETRGLLKLNISALLSNNYPQYDKKHPSDKGVFQIDKIYLFFMISKEIC